MKIEKKCWIEYFELIKNGKKTYDLRIADFECKEGDILVLKEWNPKTKQYTGRVIEKLITYVGKSKSPMHNKEDVDKYGFNIIAFKDDFLELKGANMDIDLLQNAKITWHQDKCPWNISENTNEHKCAVKNVSICKHFRGIKKPDIILCDYSNEYKQ